MDGTLVDTEPYWVESEFALVEEHGGSWSQEHAMNLVGNDLLDSGRYIREHGGIDLEPADIVEQLLDRVTARVEKEVPWRPGALELLSELRAHGVRCALVTMSYRRFADPILRHLPEGTFEVVVTGDAVSQGKPHPEPYEKAAAVLGVDPGTRWRSRTPTRGRGRRRRPAARSWWSPTTCRCFRVTGESSPRPWRTSRFPPFRDRSSTDRCEIATVSGVFSAGSARTVAVGSPGLRS